MAAVQDNTDVMEDSDAGIGMNGGSNHKCADYCRFNCANFSAYISAYWIGNMGPLLGTVFRVSTVQIVTVTLLLRACSALMGPCLAVLHDGEVIQPCLERTGCPRKKCGRRAPHLTYSTALAMVCCILAWMMPTFANQATQSQIDPVSRYFAKDTSLAFTTGSMYRQKKSDATKWGDWKAYDEKIFFDEKAGLDCSLMLQIQPIVGTLQSFNNTGPTPARAIVNYGNDICASIISPRSVCWPGPTGNPTKVGDGGPRVCAFTAGSSLAGWFFFVAFVGRLGWESQWMLSGATKWEIYPWIEERMRNNQFTALTTALGVISFAVLSVPIGGNHEMGNNPNGGASTRLTLSIVVMVLASFGFLSIKPWQDAKQASDKHVKASNQLLEWKEILTNKNTAPMRWATFTYFLASIQGTFTISTVVYFFVFVSNVPPALVGLSVGGVAILTLSIETVCAVVWNCIFGKGKGDNRADAKSSQQLRWYFLIFHLISVVMTIVGGLFVAKPLPRDQVGGPLPLIIFMAMFRVPGSIYSAWLTAISGWAIDEDYHNSLRDGLKNAKRREASWAGLRLFFRSLGGIIGFFIIASVMGGPGITPICDSTKAAKDQTMACPEGIHFFWLWLNAIFLTLMGVSGFMFPIHGERLVALIKKQGDAQKARAGTKASELTNNTPNPSVTVNTDVVKIVETPTIVETTPAVTEVPTELDE